MQDPWGWLCTNPANQFFSSRRIRFRFRKVNAELCTNNLSKQERLKSDSQGEVTGKQTVCSQTKKKITMPEDSFYLNTQINPTAHFKASAKCVVLGRFRTETSPAFFPVRSQPLVQISAEDKAAQMP